MCLKPIKISNPSKVVSLDSAQQLELTVPCGKCSECVTLQRNQWFVRTYWECQDTLNQGGYMYFDTLTYSDRCVPHISDFVPNYRKYGLDDFTVFNNSHWRLFLKNLRVKINRLGYGNCIRYFLTSEYGTNPLRTRRPHYHIIFFILDSRLHPYRLSRLVSECWKYGRTDGLPYQSNLYVKNHVYGFDLGQQFNLESALRLVCNYVSKYISKDSSFTAILEKRKQDLMRYLNLDVDIKPIIRQIDMFHRQSHGFGLSYLSLLNSSDYKRVFSSNKMRISDPSVFIKEVQLPYYYIRKLFYRLVDNGFGGKTWILTDRGKLWKSQRLLTSIASTAQNYYNTYLNMPFDMQKIVSQYLGARSFVDFATYKVLYCGRLLPAFHVDLWLDFVVNSSNPYNSENYLYHYKCGSKFLLDDFLTDKNLNDLVDSNIYRYGRLTKELQQTHPHFSGPTECGWLGNCVDFKSFVSQNCISQNTFDEFSFFDDIDNIFSKFNSKQATIKQLKFDFIEDLKKRKKGGV